MPRGATARCLSGKAVNVRVVAALRVPVALLGGATLEAGDSVRLKSALSTHARAYRLERQGEYALAR